MIKEILLFPVYLTLMLLVIISYAIFGTAAFFYFAIGEIWERITA